MKRLRLFLCLVLIMIIGLTGCDKKVDTPIQPITAAPSSTFKVEDENKEQAEKVIDVVTTIPKEIIQPEASTISNKENGKIPEKYERYLGYWQLIDHDLKYNDVIRGFNAPIDIVSVKNDIFIGSLSFRMNDSYSMNPGFTIKIQDEIKDHIVNFDFADVSFGTGSGIIVLKDDTIEIEIKLEVINESALFSCEGRTVYKKIPVENLKIPTIPKNILRYVKFSKKEMISELGKAYKNVTITHKESESIGYFYPKYGLTFEFSDEEGLYLRCIYCDEAVEINGAKAKMDFAQIQQHLGKAKLMQMGDTTITGEEIISYSLNYNIYNAILHFDSPSEDGSNSLFSISRSW